MVIHRVTIPPLVHGHLPPGEHECELADIEVAFCPAENEHRRRLFGGMSEYLDEVRTIDLFDFVYVDGSFVSDKLAPSDVDLALYADRAAGQAIRELFHRQGDHLLSGRVREDYRVHVMTGFREDRQFLELFSRVRTAERLNRGLAAGFRKGLLKVRLR